jgi:hypothetical protein
LRDIVWRAIDIAAPHPVLAGFVRSGRRSTSRNFPAGIGSMVKHRRLPLVSARRKWTAKPHLFHAQTLAISRIDATSQRWAFAEGSTFNLLGTSALGERRYEVAAAAAAPRCS